MAKNFLVIIENKVDKEQNVEVMQIYNDFLVVISMILNTTMF